MASANLVRVRYAGLDFDTHEDEILSRLQVKFATVFNDFAVSSLGIMLVDIFSFGLDTLSFYLDRRATDNFLSTARTLSSAARLARQLGYKVGASTASSVDVSITLVDQANTFPIPIGTGFKLQGPAGLVFETQEDLDFSITDTSTKVVTASEGETLQTVFASDGSANQVFQIANVPDGKFILGPGTENISQVIVEVDGEQYEEQELLVFGDTEQFEVGYNDDPPTLRFGDGIAGKIPADESEIRITFFVTSGVNGQATAGTITQPVAPLVVSFEQIDLTITNIEGTSGGSDPETIESVKANAPTVFKARNVNVTTEDYEARSRSFVDPVFGSIAVAQAISVRGSSDDAFLSSKLAAIRAEADSVVPTVNTAVASITTDSTSIGTSVDDAQLDDDALALLLADIATEEVSGTSANESSRTAAGIVSSNATSIAADLGDIDTEHDSLVTDISLAPVGTAGVGDLGATLQATLLGYLSTLDIARVAANSRNSEVITQASTLLANVTSLATVLDTIDLKTDGSEVLRAGIRVDLDAIEASNTTLAATAAALDSDIDDISDDVTTLTTEISDHVDSFLSNECQSNLIEVPVLTFDSEGFYVVPTIGLKSSLQRFLDAKKEVTQVVKVTGADNLLVAADITVFVGILSGFNESSVRSQVEAEILTVLRGRKFGITLRLSELYAPIAPSPDDVRIDGVDFVNIKVVGPTGRIDTDGNLPVQDFEVVTRGTIQVTSEIVETASVVTT
jgi:hypothetical protein